eukprot:TRINITY_DN4284_c0_g1_i1.p1 TRINITY_DN4284_c0_g1~~TRINITY_DN4284_c0_g1_i1.p1  ORF type:complete len:541 (+),score=50.84 TRINITY_DN4284_c0_g1_i1:339-1961(+)
MPAFSLRPLARAEYGTLPGLQREEKTDRMPRLWPFAVRVQPLPQTDLAEVSLKASAPTSYAGQSLLRKIAESAAATVREDLPSSHATHRTFSDGGLSSGSEHEPNSLCLAAMVNEFIEEDEKRFERRGQCTCEYGTCDGFSCLASDEEIDGCDTGELLKILQALTKCASSSERRLLAEVTAIVQAVREDDDGESLCSPAREDCSGSCLRRLVMSRLRENGYNAAICKARWDHSRGFPGGDYEYIDVISDLPYGRDRLLIDLDLRGQFQIARPTAQFSACLKVVPTVFVGRSDRLQQLVDLMTDATKRSLKRRSMPLPPWRKVEYMRAKWIAPYRRTTNEVPLSGHAAGCLAHLAKKGVAHGEIAEVTRMSQKQEVGPMPQFLEKGQRPAQVLSARRSADSGVFSSAESTPVADLRIRMPAVDAVIFAGRVVPVGDLEERVRGGMAALRSAGIPAMGDSSTQCEVGEPVTAAVQSELSHALDNVSGPVQTKQGAPKNAAHSEWQLPLVKPRESRQGKVTAGLAAILKESGSAKQATSPSQQ